MVGLVVSIALVSLSPSVAGRLQAQENSDSLTVNGGISFINPGIPTVPDAEVDSRPIPRLPDGIVDLTGPWVRGGTVADIERDGGLEPGELPCSRGRGSSETGAGRRTIPTRSACR